MFVTAFSVASTANAAGLDRSGQDISAFLQDGLYAEAVYTYINADVSGYDSTNLDPYNKAYSQGKKVDDLAESYDFFRYGVKANINDTFSVGILYDEPFGASASASGDNSFVARKDDNAIFKDLTGLDAQGVENKIADLIVTAENSLSETEREAAVTGIKKLRTTQAIAAAELSTAGEGTSVEVRSESITAILGMKFGENKNFQVYGGPVAQRLQADVRLRGTAYGPATGYTAHISPDQDYGWLAGVSYSKPEMALKAALTYRSEIDHSMHAAETYPVAEVLGINPIRSNTIEISSPKSVNFDFQTGINPTTLVTAKVRYVPWSNFTIIPSLYTEVSKERFPEGLALVDYDDDQWMVELGLVKRLTPALAVTGNIGWDSGAGNPTTPLGPIDGYYSVGLGAKYNVTKNWAVSAGSKYLRFGDAKGQLATQKIVGNFENNDGYALSMKLSYQSK